MVYLKIYEFLDGLLDLEFIGIFLVMPSGDDYLLTEYEAEDFNLALRLARAKALEFAQALNLTIIDELEGTEI